MLFNMTLRRSGYVFAFLGMLTFSFTLPMVKWALTSYNPWTITLGRMAIAGLLAVVVVVVTKTRIPDRSLWPSIARTALGISFGFPILTTLALQRTTSAHSAVIIAALPLVTAALGVITHHERVSPIFWVGAVAGSLILAVYAWFHGGSEGGDFYADVLLIGAVFASASGYSEGAKLTKVMPPWQVPTWCVILFLPVTSIAAIGSYFATAGDYTIQAKGTFGLLFTAFGSMYLGFFAWYRGLADLGVTRGSQIQLMQPLLTILWSFLMLGEHISATTFVAAVGVLSCIAITQRARHWHHKSKVTPLDLQEE